MAFIDTHKYVSVLGVSYGALERWQFGFRLYDNPATENEATCEALAPVVAAFWGSETYPAGSQYQPPPSHALAEVKVATIQPDGTYPPNDIAFSHFFIPPINGFSRGGDVPVPQTAICATLETGFPRGYASRGRMYLPPPTLGVIGADGRITVAEAQQVANAVALFIKKINDLPTVGFVHIMSRGKGTPTSDTAAGPVHYEYNGPGASREVTSVRVGRVLDTMRSRRRALVEDYQVAPVAP